MKVLIAFLLFWMPASELSQVRKIYPYAPFSAAKTSELIAVVGSYNGDNQVLLAYKGAALTLQSKFAKNLPDKTKYFKSGAKLIEAAIAKDPQNPEIRMVRLSIQENVPKIVKYRQNKTEDAKFILEHFQKQNETVKDYLRAFVLSSKSFSEAEKLSVK